MHLSPEIGDLLGLGTGLDGESMEGAIGALVHSVGHGKEHGLGTVDELLRTYRGPIGHGADLIRCADDPPQHGVSADDLRVVLPIREGEGVAHEIADVVLSPSRPELAVGGQAVDEGDSVDRYRVIVHGAHGAEDDLVRRSVEIIGHEVDEGLLDDLAREEHGREDPGLGPDVAGQCPAST